jgi:hypothetical protein
MAQDEPEKAQAIEKNPICLSGSNATAARALDGSYARFVKEWERSFPTEQAHPRHDPKAWVTYGGGIQSRMSFHKSS